MDDTTKLALQVAGCFVAGLAVGRYVFPKGAGSQSAYGYSADYNAAMNALSGPDPTPTVTWLRGLIEPRGVGNSSVEVALRGLRRH